MSDNSPVSAASSMDDGIGYDDVDDEDYGDDDAAAFICYRDIKNANRQKWQQAWVNISS